MMKMIDPNEEMKQVQEIEVQEQPKDTLEYWPITDLPSKFKLYPEGTKILGRKLNVIEVKKLGLMNDITSDFVITEILKSTIKGIDINKIYQADKLYLLLWLRANTFNEPGYSIDYHCIHCDKDSTYDFTLNKLDVKYLDEEFFKNNEIKLKSGDTLRLNFLTVKDEEIIDKFKIEFAKMNLNDDILELAQQIKLINGENIPLINKYEYLTKLDVTEYLKIEAIMKKYDFGIRPFINVKCPLCGGDSPVGITFRKSFLVPEYRIG